MEKSIRKRNSIADLEEIFEILSILEKQGARSRYSRRESNIPDGISSDSVISTDDEDCDTTSDYETYLKAQKRFGCLRIIIDLPMYPPSEKIKISENLNFSAKSLYDNNTETFLTDSKLNKHNIHFVYKMLLEIEDISSMLEYVPLAQKDVMLNSTGSPKEYWISLKDCPNIEEIVTPLIDEVVLVPKAGGYTDISASKYKTDLLLRHEHENENSNDLFRRRTATVRQISKDRAYFRFSKDDHFLSHQLTNRRYDIIFRSRRYPIRYQHYAIELLSQNEEIREYLFPNRRASNSVINQSPFKSSLLNSKLNLFNPTIASNPEQLMGVQHIIETPDLNAPFIIFGPPGTGKTTLTVESILQLRFRYPSSCILVSAGSNSACDTIAVRICKYLESDPRLKGVATMNQKALLRIYSKSIMDNGINTIDPVLKKYSNCMLGIHAYPSVEYIQQYGIIVATLCTVGKLVTAGVGNVMVFTHIFLDEAGASTVPEALVGIMGIKKHSSCRLILSGDHKQLGPILKSKQAAELGLEQSLMEQLLKCECYAVDDNFNYDCTLQARLRRNYRSHPEIVRLYNHLYYNNELIAEAKEEDVNLAAKWCKLPNPKFPIIFQAVHGVTEKRSISPSSFNKLEVDVLMWFLRRLLNDGINGERVKQTDIGIITPYKLQNKLIQRRLNQSGWRDIENGSVETFQGREKQIIIVSLVRSFAGLGFVRNPKRLNVLLSRPKSLLILIGNPLTLRRHSDFAFVLDECEKQGTFLRGKKRK